MRAALAILSACVLAGCEADVDEEDPVEGCDISQYEGITLPEIVDAYAQKAHPLLQGCQGCHSETSGRLFRITADPLDSFHSARAGGMFQNVPAALLDRLTTADPVAAMPPGSPWPEENVKAVAEIVCMLEAYEAPGEAAKPDEEFPPNLLAPYTGPPIDYYDNTFLTYPQLKNKVKVIFNDDWIRNSVDRWQANIGLFGGVDFTGRFTETREPTADFLLGLDRLAPQVCAPASTNRTGPFTGLDTAAAISGSAAADAATSQKLTTLYQKLLFRAPTATERTQAVAMLKDLVSLGGTPASAWSGMCEALVRHPDFLFTLPPSYATADAADKPALLLVKLAQDLVARPPTAAELAMLASGQTYEQMVDYYLASTEFRDFYFHRMRLRTESDGTADTDEPARLLASVVFNGKPYQEIFIGDYSVDQTFAPVPRPAHHGKTGLLTMKGFIANKPGLPGYNYAARVMSDYLGVVFEVPDAILEQRATSSPASTVDPTGVCYSCHQNLTPLAHQRLRWDDDGVYRETDSDGNPIDDSDRNLVETYAFKGQGMEAFASQAVKKEMFIRRIINTQFSFLLGREMRHALDERVIYKQLWDLGAASSGDMRATIKSIVTSPTYRGE